PDGDFKIKCRFGRTRKDLLSGLEPLLWIGHRHRPTSRPDFEALSRSLERALFFCRSFILRLKRAEKLLSCARLPASYRACSSLFKAAFYYALERVVAPFKDK